MKFDFSFLKSEKTRLREEVQRQSEMISKLESDIAMTSAENECLSDEIKYLKTRSFGDYTDGYIETLIRTIEELSGVKASIKDKVLHEREYPHVFNFGKEEMTSDSDEIIHTVIAEPIYRTYEIPKFTAIVGFNTRRLD